MSMLEGSLNRIYIKRPLSRIWQGDILRDIEYIGWITENPEEEKLQRPIKIHLPYIVVLTQDCDLKQDYNSKQDNNRKDEDKFLLSILVCPAYTATSVKEGTHLKDYGLDRQHISRNQFEEVKKNHIYRYHYLESETDLQIPELVIDFKQYYTIPRDGLYEFYKKKYLATINYLFRESLSKRFAYYLSRIGLPTIKS